MPPKQKKEKTEAEKQQEFEAKFGKWKSQSFKPRAFKLSERRCGVKDKKNLQVTNELEAVFAIWPLHVWQQIVADTNERAISKTPGWTAADANQNDDSDSGTEDELEDLRDAPESPSKAKWKDLDIAELKVWFGILITMGLCPEPSFHKYWEKKETSGGMFGNDFIRNSGMSRDRWSQIRRFLFCDLDWLTNETVKSSQTLWRPYPYISIDETLLLFKGRYAFRQHIKGKPNATGLKMYAICDSTGFIYGFWFYQGDHPTIHDLVLDFVKQLEDKENVIIVLDSYYGNYSIMESLQAMGVKYIMACQQNRPSDIWQQRLSPSKGEWESLVKNNSVMALKFYDKKNVCIFTNCVADGEIEKIRRNKTKKIPEVIDCYNRWMHGVDLADRFINHHMPRHRSDSWKRAVFQGLWYICVTNALHIYNECMEKKLSLTEFLTGLALHMVPVQEKSPTKSSHLSKMHLIKKVDKPADKRKCKHCLDAGKHSSSAYYCPRCQEFLHADCFEEYHTLHMS